MDIGGHHDVGRIKEDSKTSRGDQEPEIWLRRAFITGRKLEDVSGYFRPIDMIDLL
jgi:hypothetical protein